MLIWSQFLQGTLDITSDFSSSLVVFWWAKMTELALRKSDMMDKVACKVCDSVYIAKTGRKPPQTTLKEHCK